ncbi:MAG: CBS domain-containing protein [Nitrososphaerales archaeon]
MEDYRYRELVSSSPTETVYNSAVQMENKHVGCVLITSDGKVLGVATRYDFLHNIIVGGMDAKTTEIKEIMHASPVSIESKASAAEALRKMVDKRVERLVVLSGTNILGVVSLEDIVAMLEADNTLNSISKDRAEQVRDMIKKLTPYFVARYDGEDRSYLERDMNDETKALLRLLEELEVTLRP